MSDKDGEESKDQFNVYLRTDVIRDIKHAAIDSGRKLGEFVESIFKDYLQRQRAPKKGRS
jgi:hypothetical protein